MHEQIISLLTAERDKLDRAIVALTGEQKRRGRPRKNPLELVAAPKPASNGYHMSKAKRAEVSRRMKRYWAKRRKAA